MSEALNNLVRVMRRFGLPAPRTPAQAAQVLLLKRTIVVYLVLCTLACILTLRQHAVATQFNTADNGAPISMMIPLLSRLLQVIKDVLLAGWFPAELEKFTNISVVRGMLGMVVLATGVWVWDDVQTFRWPSRACEVAHQVAAFCILSAHVAGFVLASLGAYSWTVMRALEIWEGVVYLIGLCAMRWLAGPGALYPPRTSLPMSLLINTTFTPLASLALTPENRSTMAAIFKRAGLRHATLTLKELPASWLLRNREGGHEGLGEDDDLETEVFHVRRDQRGSADTASFRPATSEERGDSHHKAKVGDGPWSFVADEAHRTTTMHEDERAYARKDKDS